MLITVWGKCYVDVPLVKPSFRYAFFLMHSGATHETENNQASTQSLTKFSHI